MRIAIMTILVVGAFANGVMAAEPEDRAVIRDHTLGRVFMDSAERRRLDLLRKAPPLSERSGAVDSGSESIEVPQTKKANPVGYIVPSNGSPYQWIDGDFRHVTRVEIDKADDSQSIEITRHGNEPDVDDRSLDVEEPLSLEQTGGVESEAGDANRSLQ